MGCDWGLAGDGIRCQQDLGAEGFDVKQDCGLDVGKRFLMSGTFADHGTLYAERVGHVAVRVFRNDDFDLVHYSHFAPNIESR
jgi:hypothetical protein